MTIDLSQIPWRIAGPVLQYCWKNGIELKKIREIASSINRYPTQTECKDQYVFDISDDHFLIMTLLGIFNDND